VRYHCKPSTGFTLPPLRPGVSPSISESLRRIKYMDSSLPHDRGVWSRGGVRNRCVFKAPLSDFVTVRAANVNLCAPRPEARRTLMTKGRPIPGGENIFVCILRESKPTSANLKHGDTIERVRTMDQMQQREFTFLSVDTGRTNAQEVPCALNIYQNSQNRMFRESGGQITTGGRQIDFHRRFDSFEHQICIAQNKFCSLRINESQNFDSASKLPSCIRNTGVYHDGGNLPGQLTKTVRQFEP
jgi:hypothetical protein